MMRRQQGANNNNNQVRFLYFKRKPIENRKNIYWQTIESALKYIKKIQEYINS